MQYLEFTFTITPWKQDYQDILEAVLGEIGFDSFINANQEGGNPILAYAPFASFREEELQETLQHFPIPGILIKHERKEAEEKNWNQIWEENYFQPLNIDDRCMICAPFHENPTPKEYNILIQPKMSFGTGNHETTLQMIRNLLELPVKDQTVIDMGCGTGILAILCRLRGAKKCFAIDYDKWCAENTRENIGLNRLDNIIVKEGDASALNDIEKADLFLANIHKNIIIADLPAYARRIRPLGRLIVSGFYDNDLESIRIAASSLGFELEKHTAVNQWCCARFILQKTQ